MTLVHLTPISGNAKTGPIPVSTSTSKTCPASCPFNKGNGCYAGSGPLALHWRKVTSGERSMGWNAFCAEIAALASGQLWRHNQAGDLPGSGESIDKGEFLALVQANEGKRGFTYTHKTAKANHDLIRFANAKGFTVNLSANSLSHADTLADAKAGPVVTVLPATQTTNTVTPAGRRVVVCPAAVKEGVSCATCQLCQKANRSVIVGFPAHGTQAKKATAIASN
jgi:hypothetical protein